MTNSEAYNKLIRDYSPQNKENIKKLYEERIKIHKERIKNGMRTDKDHIDLINLCANVFQYGSNNYRKYGYYVIKTEPLYELNVKNFDLAIYNDDNGCLILVECKSSFGSNKEVVNDIKGGVEICTNNVDLLERAIEKKISRIDYVLCTDGNLAKDFCEYVTNQDEKIITWGITYKRKDVKLYRSGSETHKDAILNGRLHLDEKLNSSLYAGLITKRGFTRTFRIIPSLNMGLILIEIYSILQELKKNGGLFDNYIDYPVIRSILDQHLLHSTLSDADLDELTYAIINKSKEKKLLTDKKENGKVIDDIYEILISLNSFKVVNKKTESNYIDINAHHKAQNDILEKYEQKPKSTTIDDFTQ